MIDRIFLDLFSGIGGFALGAYWAGLRFDKHYFLEIDEYAVQIYRKCFPDAEPLGDIKNVDYTKLPKGEWLVTGGFPCQPHSVAGKKKGAGDKRDLWPECARMLGELRPSVALFENVPGLFVSNGGRFFNRILSDISESGYDAEWQIISAQDLGAPHLRKRIWIVAYSQEQYRPVKRQETPIAGRSRHDVANTEGRRKQELPKRDNRRETQIGHGAGTSGGSRRGDTSERVIGSRRITPELSANVSYSDSQRCEEQFNAVTGGSRNTDGPDCGNMADTDPRQRKHGGEIYAGTMTEEFGERYCNEWWAVEPNVGRVAHGIPFRMDRLKGIGNSVVPWCVNKILLLPAFDRWRR